MQYISLSNNSLTYFTSKGRLTELSGSSKYNVFDGEIVSKEKRQTGKIENRSCILDYTQNMIHDNMTEQAFERLIYLYNQQKQLCISHKYTSETENNALEYYEKLLSQFYKFGNEFPFKLSAIRQQIEQTKSRYQTVTRKKNDEKKINKSKVKGKMYALFNLKCSRKFMAFYSVSFPLGTNDDQAFECWNAWLTCLRKRFGLLNYIWVTERQKNGTLHYHMLTNNYMPILQINRAMAIIINNKVIENVMSWGGSSLDRYNGVDVDSIFNSKRHKKTGKILNPAELRNWLTKYITKYVTKNTEKFTHLCWHCSRTVSILFTTTIIDIRESKKVTDFLPRLRNLYMNFKSDFNNTWVFLFVPPDNLFEMIRMYNDWLFVEFEPQNNKIKSNINYKTTTL